MQGFNRLQIVPLLHQNFIHFKDTKHKSDYLYAAQMKDVFHTLTLDNKVKVWCLQSGDEKGSYDFNISA